MTGLLLANALGTLVMTGLAWFVQLVHYPLFRLIPADGFAAYEREHVRRTSWVVVPTMLLEATAAALLVAVQPEALTVAGVLLLAIVWASTFGLQVPAHARLEHGFDGAVHARLVGTSWIRTLAWSGRATIALALLAAT